MELNDYISLALSVVAVILSIYVWIRNRSSERYRILDDRLLSILQINLDYPEFDDAAFTSKYDHSDNERLRQQYEIYAMIVWNFLESIFGYYGERGIKRSSFFGVLRYWSTLHQTWLSQQEEKSDYAPKFRRYVARVLTD